MKLFIQFPNGVDRASLAALVQIQERGNPVTWEKYGLVSPGQFASQHGLHPGSVTRLLKRPDCPKIEGRIGPSGRVIQFRTTLELTAFLTKNQKS